MVKFMVGLFKVTFAAGVAMVGVFAGAVLGLTQGWF